MTPEEIAVAKAAADAATAAANATEEIEIQGGVKVAMTAAKAAAYRDARSKEQIQRDGLAERIRVIDTEKATAVAAAAQAVRNAEAAEAMKAGDITKATDLLTAKHREQLDRVAKRSISDAMTASATKLLPGLDTSDYSDIVALNSHRCRLNPDTLAIEVLNEAGQPLLDPKSGLPAGVDSLVADFAKSRKRFTISKMPAGDGVNVGRVQTSITGDTISLEEQQAMMNAGTWNPTVHGKLKVQMPQ
jgi:hypothetical protein